MGGCMGSKIQLLASVIQFAAYWYLTFRFGIAPAVKDARCPPEHLRHAIDTHWLRITVVKKDLVAHLHVIPHEVAGLIIAYAVQTRTPIALQIGNRIDIGF